MFNARLSREGLSATILELEQKSVENTITVVRKMRFFIGGLH
jgi:hypothetical protein